MVELDISIPSSEIIYLNKKFNLRICLVAKKSVKNIRIRCVLPKRMKIIGKVEGKISQKELIFTKETNPDLEYLHKTYAKTIEFPVIVNAELPVIEVQTGDKEETMEKILDKFLSKLELSVRFTVEYEPIKIKRSKSKIVRKTEKKKEFILGFPMIEILPKESFFDDETKTFVLFVRNIGIVDAYNTNFNFSLDIFAETAVGDIELQTHDFHNNILRIRYTIPPTDIGGLKSKLKIKQKIPEVEILPTSIYPSAIICKTISSS